MFKTSCIWSIFKYIFSKQTNVSSNQLAWSFIYVLNQTNCENENVIFDHSNYTIIIIIILRTVNGLEQSFFEWMLYLVD